MLTHEKIWTGLDRLADAFGYSPSGLARRAGLDPTAFNLSKRVGPKGKPRWPSTESVAKVLTVTETTLSDLGQFMDAQSKPKPRHNQNIDTIPVLGFAQALKPGAMDKRGLLAGSGWDVIEYPATPPHAFALRITGKGYEPCYRPGDVLILAPGLPVKRGNRVVVKLRGGEILIKELVSQTGGRIVLRALSPDAEDRIFSPGDILWMTRILWISQ